MSYSNDSIKVWISPSFSSVINKAIECYHSYVDGSVQFDVEELSVREIYDRLLSYADIEDFPDLILIQDQDIKRYLTSFKEAFVALDEWIDASKYKDRKNSGVTYDGRIYGWPCTNEPVALYYNKDICSDLPYDNLTWAEIIELGKTLKLDNGIYLFPPAQCLTQILMQSTGKLYYDDNGQVSAEGAKGVLTLIKSLNDVGAFAPSSFTSEEIKDLIRQKKIAAIIGSTSWFSMIKSIATTSWGISKLPKSENLPYDVDLGGYSFLVVNKGDHDKAIDFLKCIFNPEEELSKQFAYDMAEKYDMLPSDINIWELFDELQNDGCFTDQHIIKFLSEIDEETSIPKIYYGGDTTNLTDTLAEIILEVVGGAKTAKEGYEEFEDICDELIEGGNSLELDYIVIEREPNRVDYYKYEKFESDGMIVHAYYKDGTDAIVSGYRISPYILTLNDTYVRVSYTSGGKTKVALQQVNVKNREIASLTISTNHIFVWGDTIDSSFFTVKVNYNVGEPIIADSKDFEVSPTTLNSVGDVKISVYYRKEEDAASGETHITVYDRLKSIEVDTAPKKSAYYDGERFERYGMRVIAHYYGGAEAEVPLGRLVINPNIVRFKSGEEKKKLALSYTEHGITAQTSLTAYKKTGVDLEDADITQDMEKSGSGKLNLSTGMLTYTFHDFTGYDSVLPIKISHIYKEEFDDECHVGKSWRLNLQQEIVWEDGKWQYTDKEGRIYSFDDGYDSKDERSAIRNEKLGLDLFEDKDNSTIHLVDRNNNTLEFALIGEKYRLSAMHIFPSTPSDTINAYALHITYYADGRINTITAGKEINGNRPVVQFVYTANNLLSELKYSLAKETTIARYRYDSGNLTGITLVDDNTQAEIKRTTTFRYTEKSFTIFDETSENTDGTKKTLTYAKDESGKIESYSIGYGEKEQDKTTIVYTADTITMENGADISLSAVIESKKDISIVSFNSMGVVSQYSYDIADSSLQRPKKVNDATSRGFNYQSLANTYSDTLDIYHDDFENGIDNWKGAKKTSIRAISGESCISGATLQKEYTLTASDIIGETTIYLSLWAATDTNAIATNIKITISGSESWEITHKLDRNLANKWQFAAFCLGKRKVGDIITIEVSNNKGTIYLDDVRLTKSPYETPDDIPDTIYDAFGNVTKTYQYNPIDEEIEQIEYTYNDAHQLTQQLQTSGKKQRSKITNTYDKNGLQTQKREYGKSSIYYTQESCSYTNYILTTSIDANNVKTQYSEGTDSFTTTIIGEKNSPNMMQTEERFSNSGTTKMLTSDSLKNTYLYSENGNLQTAKFHYNRTSYKAEMSFEYDTFGNLYAVKIGEVSLVECEYDYKHLNKITYANGDDVSYTYDIKDRIVAIQENGEEVATIDYSDDEENFVDVVHSNGLIYTSASINSNGQTSEYSVEFEEIRRILRVVGCAANGTGNITATEYYIEDGGDPFEKCTYTKDGNGLLTKIEREYHGASSTTYNYDNLYRLTSKTTKYAATSARRYKTAYTYNNVSGNQKGTRITEENHSIGSNTVNYAYSYYANGNLKSITSGSDVQSEYIYDEYGRLIQENNYALGQSYKLTYDNGGNITRKETYIITDNKIASRPTQTDIYDYETITDNYGQNAAWKDQLKGYNGVAIKYDKMGNPLNYLGIAMTWNGRKLMTANGIAMEYDYNGLRVKKGDKIYYWQNDNLIMERWMKNGEENYIYYHYDESGVCGMNYNGTEYYYLKNILGDIIAIYDTLGNLQCRYVYDAWGNHKIYNAGDVEITTAEETHIGNINPLRYRGYYWDSEFNLYYLQSRYYDANLGRFISVDRTKYLNPKNTLGFNMYLYCNDNPIMCVDPTGAWSWDVFMQVLTMRAIVGAAALGIVLSVATGGVAGTVIAGALIGFAASALDNVVTQVKEVGWGSVNYKETWKAGGIGAAIGAVSGLFSYGFAQAAGAIGSKVGFAFSQTTHIGSGITFGTVFGTSTLTTLGAGVGKAVGQISGSVLGDYLGSSIVGEEYTLKDKLGDLVSGELPGLILDFVRWGTNG